MSDPARPAETAPEWVTGLRLHPGMKIGNLKEWEASLEGWSALDDATRTFMQAHLTYLLVRAVGGIFSNGFKIGRMLAQIGSLNEGQLDTLEKMLDSMNGEEAASEEVEPTVVAEPEGAAKPEAARPAAAAKPRAPRAPRARRPKADEPAE